MSDEPKQVAAKPKLRWFQYSLRSLLVLALLVSIAMSWFAVRMNRAKTQRAAVEAIEKAGGRIGYDYQFDDSGAWKDVNKGKPEPPTPKWLRNLLGDDFFATVVYARVGSDDAMAHSWLVKLLQACP